MGTISHNAIIATTFRDEEINAAKKWVAAQNDRWQRLFLFGDSNVNGYRNVVMIPDGSKEWWAESDAGNDLRDAFVTFLESGYWEWAEVQYGELGNRLVRPLTEGNSEKADD